MSDFTNYRPSKAIYEDQLNEIDNSNSDDWEEEELNFQKKNNKYNVAIKHNSLDEFKKIFNINDDVDFAHILCKCIPREKHMTPEIFIFLCDNINYEKQLLCELLDSILDSELFDNTISICEYLLKKYINGRDTQELIIRKNVFKLFKLQVDLNYKSHIWNDVIVYGRMFFIKYLEDKDKSLPENNHLMEYAIKSSSIDVVNYLLSKGCDFPDNTFDLICQKYFEIGHIDHSYYSKQLSESFTLKIAEYLIERKFPLNKNICSKAAKYGKLYLIKFLRENECEWDENVFINSMVINKNYDLDIILYAIENNCPCSEKVLTFSEELGSIDLYDLINNYLQRFKDF